MQRHHENTPRRPLTTIPPAVRQTLYHSPGQRAGPDQINHASDQTIVSMGEVHRSHEPSQPQFQRSTPWDATSNTIHPAPTAMTPGSINPNDPRRLPPPPVYMLPGSNSLPAPVLSTYAPQVTMHGSSVGIQSAAETVPIPPANRDSYPILPHLSYGMQAPSPSVQHPQVVGQPSPAFVPPPSNKCILIHKPTSISLKHRSTTCFPLK